MCINANVELCKLYDMFQIRSYGLKRVNASRHYRLLNALLHLLRFKTFQRILKQDECDLNQSIGDILERHMLSGSLQREQV